MQSLETVGLASLHDVITRLHTAPDLDPLLQAIVDGVVEVSGFGVSAITVYRPGTDELELVAVSGDAPSLDDHLHRRFPAPAILERNRLGEQWGLFRFISHRLELDVPEGFIVVPQQARDEPGAWHALDELSVELRSPTGDLLGLMYVDRPADGMLPGKGALATMEIYAVAAGIAIDYAQQRAAQHEGAWLGGMVRSMVDHLAGPDELHGKLENLLAQLRTELRAPVSWLDVFGDVEVAGVAPAADHPAFTLVAALDSYGRELALSATEDGHAVVLDLGRLSRPHPLLSDQQRAWLTRALKADGVTSLALVPLDNDEGIEGQLVLGRSNDRSWTAAELDAVRLIGRELGWALGRERSRVRERSAEEELTRSARERRDLLRALGREITPLFTRLDTHMSTLPPDSPAGVSMESCWTLLGRVDALVSFEGHGHRPHPTVVDMAAVLGSVWGHLAELGRREGVQVLPVEGSSGHLAWADPEELEWVAHLLTEDVVLQAPPGSAVRFGLVTLNHRVVLSCQVSGPEADAHEPGPRDSEHSDLPADAAMERVPGGGHPGSEAGTTSPGRTPGPPAGIHPPPWWHIGAQQVLARSDARLTTREGPLGRRVVSLSVPAPRPPA